MPHGPHSFHRLVEDEDFARVVADGMQALAAPSRLRILAHLAAGPASVTVLARAVGMEGSAVSHQLRLLRQHGLVVGRRAGRSVVYELHDDHVERMLLQAVGHTEHVQEGRPGRTRRPGGEAV